APPSSEAGAFGLSKLRSRIYWAAMPKLGTGPWLASCGAPAGALPCPWVSSAMGGTILVLVYVLMGLARAKSSLPAGWLLASTFGPRRQAEAGSLTRRGNCRGRVRLSEVHCPAGPDCRPPRDRT